MDIFVMKTELSLYPQYASLKTAVEKDETNSSFVPDSKKVY